MERFGRQDVRCDCHRPFGIYHNLLFIYVASINSQTTAWEGRLCCSCFTGRIAFHCEIALRYPYSFSRGYFSIRQRVEMLMRSPQKEHLLDVMQQGMTLSEGASKDCRAGGIMSCILKYLRETSPESKRPADAKSCATDNAEYSRLNSFENSARRSARVHPKHREIGPVRVQPASLVSLCFGEPHPSLFCGWHWRRNGDFQRRPAIRRRRFRLANRLAELSWFIFH